MKTKKTKTVPLKLNKYGLPFGPGDAVLIRTVTEYAIGRVALIGPDSITLTEASWVAATGRFSEAVANGTLDEVERVGPWMVVGRGAIVDIVPWLHDLPKETR